VKYLLAPVGTEGDIRPLVALGLALRAAGHDALFGASVDHGPFVQSAGLPFVAIGKNTREFFLANPGMTKGGTIGTIGPMVRAFDAFVGAQVEGLLKHAPGVDMIVGAGLMFAGSSVAQKLGTRYRHVVHIPAMLPSSEYAPVTVPQRDMPRFVNAVLWHVSRATLTLLMGPAFNRHRTSMGLPRMRDLQSLLTQDVIVAMDPALGAVPRDVKARFWVTGYWPLHSNEELPTHVASFIDNGDQPVYLGFGSMSQEDPAATMALIDGAVHDAGVRAIVAGGWAGLETARASSRICVSRHLPHHALLPRVAAAIHHGGAGTVWTCARAGIPQCAVPHMLDQFYWGDRIRRLGIGPGAVPRNKLTRARLAAMLRDVTSTQTYRDNARALALPLSRRDGVAEGVRLLGL